VNRRVAGAGLLVAVLVVVAGIASQGRPLSTHRGSGPTATFFDYLATTLVLFAIFMAMVVVIALVSMRKSRGGTPRGRWHVLSSVVALLSGITLAYLIVHSGFEQRLKDILARQQPKNPPKQQPSNATSDPSTIRNARIRWDEVAIVLVLVSGTVVLLLAARGARRAPRLLSLRREEVVSDALDESLDDLRNDPDLRRAIITAYARMERTLAAVGLARHPAEAPFEYMERALRSLDTSAEAAKRLTALFEWAKFSHHEPEQEMRDDAIAALVAVRDELRAPAAVTA
jgi:Domain of unknown function (DUF4129)